MALLFDYDNRGRLIREARYDADPTHEYHIAYEYDQGGNRTKKIESKGGCNRIETIYTYDYEAPESYGSFNNRLMFYETYETCRVFEDYGHTGGCGTEEQVSTTWYYYNSSGNVTNVITEKADPYSVPLFEATRLEYARNGRAVTYVLGESWGNTAYDIAYAREFRYDSARQRYMNRELDPEALEGGMLQSLSTVWSDYDGDQIYGDFTFDGQDQNDVRSFDLGLGKFSWTAGQPDPATVQHYHTNMIGTTRQMTDANGDAAAASVFTAFGERVNGTHHRYGYAGSHGYQTTLDDGASSQEVFPFLHVGHRYYDPSTGRFLQRDPIGIMSGTNVYAYMLNMPTVGVDPDGEFWGFIGVISVIATAVIVNYLLKALSEKVPDHSKDDEKDIEQLIEELDPQNRSEDLDDVKDITEDLARTTPQTPFTGPSVPPGDTADGIMDLIMSCLSRL